MRGSAQGPCGVSTERLTACGLSGRRPSFIRYFWNTQMIKWILFIVEQYFYSNRNEENRSG